jgi:hypothetical protein
MNALFSVHVFGEFHPIITFICWLTIKEIAVIKKIGRPATGRRQCL